MQGFNAVAPAPTAGATLALATKPVARTMMAVIRVRTLVDATDAELTGALAGCPTHSRFSNEWEVAI
jgi:hypothetical protein